MYPTITMTEKSKPTGASSQIGGFDMIDRGTILVVDDDAAILQMLELMLEDAGFAVVKASDGREALELVRMHQPDLVLIDFMMPNLDGCTVCRRLKSEEDTRSLPVVIMSASREVAARAAEANANAYILKPFDLEEMLGCLQNSLDGVRPWSFQHSWSID